MSTSLPDDERLIKDKARSALARSKLVLSCDDPVMGGGRVWIEFEGRTIPGTEVVVRTKADAFNHLQVFRAKGGGPQVAFLQAVRSADWLTGPMPSALLTAPGAYRTSGKLQVIPMDAKRARDLRSGDDASNRAQLALLRSLMPVR